MQSFDTNDIDSRPDANLPLTVIIGRVEELPVGSRKTIEYRTNARLLYTTLMANSMPPPPHAGCPRGDPGTENSGPHRGAPLSEGILCDRGIECDWHGWQFDLRTGECLTVTEKTLTYQVIVEEELVKILI
ncbi:MAG: Rieske (2Fe-2S) protein [Pyrinomonadaceae bacterium]